MAKGGADPSFVSVFPDLLRAAFRVAYRILGTTSPAEEVAAEALARAYANWSKVRSLTRPDAWVVRVAGNLAIDTIRRRRPPLEPTAAADPQEIAVARVSLGRALRSLPRRQREVVLLRYLGGFAESEVAEMLGISAGAVKSHGHRGLASLRSRLADFNKDFDFET